jgi:hypothetical protein
MFKFLRDRKRAEIKERPFPEEWRAILRKNVPHYTRLPEEDRKELEGHVMVFLEEKPFEGCGGQEITDEVRVTIAGEACLLLLHRDTDYYPGLDVILVYPSAYVAKKQGMIEHDEARLGESHQRGIIVLAWDSVLSGCSNIGDGHNVVLHELAHQLDQEDGDADGAPVLEERSMYRAWAQVLSAEFEQLVEDTESHRKTVLDKYGATNPAEFFAVLTEAFFEKPRQLKARHPELYEQLVTYYRQDPLTWIARSGS